MEPARITPMMHQYLRIKERYQDAILFFRLGDFYEMFFEDAETASRILDIALTSRNKNETPRCLCAECLTIPPSPIFENSWTPATRSRSASKWKTPRPPRVWCKGKWFVLSPPARLRAPTPLDARGNNFLAAVYEARGDFGLAVTDVTTGEFRFTQLADEQFLFDEISRIQTERVAGRRTRRRLREQLQKTFPAVHLTLLADVFFSEMAAGRLVKEQFTEASHWQAGIRAASAVVGYLESNAADSLQVLRDLEPYAASGYLVLDETTRINLELVSNYQGDRKGSLLAVIDRTLTPMGARRLRQCLLYPLLDEQAIRERHDGVQELVDHFQLRQELKLWLRKIQ